MADIKLFQFITFILLCDGILSQSVSNDDATLNFMGLAKKYGHPAEEYKLTTEDGYILTMHRIPGKGRPVFLQHGILDSDETYILRGRKSMAIVLAKAGFDVWLGNSRGNKYSRRHVSLNPDTDKRFWIYSVHEMGIYDLPAMIDLVLSKTGYSQLSAIGHSQGNTIFFVLGASRPEYNKKVKVLIALAPICFIHHIKPPLSTLIQFAPLINNLLISMGEEELLSDHSTFNQLSTFLCPQLHLSLEICIEGGFFISGSDPKEMDEEFGDVLMSHFPTGTSRTNILHDAQIARAGRFQRLDYGRKTNLKIYGTKTPPEYDLKKVTMRVELFVGKNDKVSTIEDVNILRKKLPNARYTLLSHSNMNHMDFVWGKHMDKYLFPHVLEVLKTE